MLLSSTWSSFQLGCIGSHSKVSSPCSRAEGRGPCLNQAHASLKSGYSRPALANPRKVQWGWKPRVPWSIPKQAGVRQAAEGPPVLSLNFNLISSYFNLQKSPSVRQGGREGRRRACSQFPTGEQHSQARHRYQDHAVCTRLDFGAASRMAQIAQEQCCHKPRAGAAVEGWVVTSTLCLEKHLIYMKTLQKQQNVAHNSDLQQEISLSSVALCEIAQIFS